MADKEVTQAREAAGKGEGGSDIRIEKEATQSGNVDSGTPQRPGTIFWVTVATDEGDHGRTAAPPPAPGLPRTHEPTADAEPE